MLGHIFFHDLIRKYVATFGTLFNDIKLRRTNRLGAVTQTIEVPLTYGPRDKFVTRLQQDSDLNSQVAITLPRISFEIVRMGFDPSRQLPATNKIIHDGTANKVKRVFTQVPYDIQFALNVYTMTNEDGVRIVEQILPFFVPQFAPTVQLLEEPDMRMDIPIILNGITTQDLYDGAFEQRRVLVHTLDFLMKAYMIGPVVEKPLILFANTNFRIDGFNSAIGTSNNDVEAFKFRPGQFANGLPTSNGALSVAANTILPNSNFGVITTFSSTVMANDSVITIG
tara:strand:- start:25 stop:870 length:846 start_codon:yes stop_codon:yes gene_type:complete